MLGSHCKNETKQMETQNELGLFCGPLRASRAHFLWPLQQMLAMKWEALALCCKTWGEHSPLLKGIHPQKQGWKSGLATKCLFPYLEYKPLTSLSLTRAG